MYSDKGTDLFFAASLTVAKSWERLNVISRGGILAYQQVREHPCNSVCRVPDSVLGCSLTHWYARISKNIVSEKKSSCKRHMIMLPFVCAGKKKACVNLEKFWKNTQETKSSDYLEWRPEVRSEKSKRWEDQGLEWEGNHPPFTFLYLFIFKSYDCVIDQFSTGSFVCLSLSVSLPYSLASRCVCFTLKGRFLSLSLLSDLSSKPPWVHEQNPRWRWKRWKGT